MAFPGSVQCSGSVPGSGRPVRTTGKKEKPLFAFCFPQTSSNHEHVFPTSFVQPCLSRCLLKPTSFLGFVLPRFFRFFRPRSRPGALADVINLQKVVPHGVQGIVQQSRKNFAVHGANARLGLLRSVPWRFFAPFFGRKIAIMRAQCFKSSSGFGRASWTLGFGTAAGQRPLRGILQNRSTQIPRNLQLQNRLLGGTLCTNTTPVLSQGLRMGVPLKQGLEGLGAPMVRKPSCISELSKQISCVPQCPSKWPADFEIL